MAYNSYKKKSKYNSEPVEAWGLRFDSKNEMHRYAYLRMFQNSGVIKDLTFHKRFDLIPKGDADITLHFPDGDKHVKMHFDRARFYEADFTYTVVKTGEDVVEDFKGYETTEFKHKRELFRLVYGKDIKVVKLVNANV